MTSCASVLADLFQSAMSILVASAQRIAHHQLTMTDTNISAETINSLPRGAFAGAGYTIDSAARDVLRGSRTVDERGQRALVGKLHACGLPRLAEAVAALDLDE